MSELNAKIKPLATGYSGAVPAPADLDRGELALNTADRRLFTKHGNDLVYEVGRTKITDMADYDGAQIPADGDVLAYDVVAGKWDNVAYVSLATLKSVVAASTDFADFQSRIAAL